jgi:hypothetical protein
LTGLQLAWLLFEETHVSVDPNVGDDTDRAVAFLFFGSDRLEMVISLYDIFPG